MRLLAAFVCSLFLFSTAAFAAPTVKEWSFLVFLNGDNNLDSFGDTNINQMKAVGSTNDVNIVVLRDRANQSTSAKVLYVEKNKTTTVKDYGRNIDMGDWKQVVEFFKFSIEKYPAKHYVMVMWDHGAGWKKRTKSTFRDISMDDGTGNFITTPQLAQAFAEMKTLNGGKNIDIMGADACLMQMAEVVAQVAPSVSVTAASEEVEPGEGWDYAGALQYLTQNPTASAEALGDAIQKAYVAGNAGQSVQGSAVSTEALMAAVPQISALAEALAKFDKIDRTKMASIITATQKFYYSDYRDMLDFLKRLQAATNDATLKQLAKNAELTIQATIKANYTSGSSMANAKGLSVWLPSSSQYASRKVKYQELDWAKQTKWGAFLAALYQ